MAHLYTFHPLWDHLAEKTLVCPLPNTGKIQLSTSFSRRSIFVGHFEPRKNMHRKNKGWGGGGHLGLCGSRRKLPPKIEKIMVMSKSRAIEFLWLPRLLFIDKCSAECRNRQNNTLLTTQPYHSVSQHHAGVKTGGTLPATRWRALQATTVKPTEPNEM